MTNDFDRNKCLELTANMVMEAIRGGTLQNANGQTVADFFLRVYQSVIDCAALQPSDLPEIIRLLAQSQVG